MGCSSVELRKFVSPEIITGENSSLLIGRYIAHFGSKRPLIVTDPGIEAQPWFDDILEQIRAVSVDVSIFNHVTPNPKAKEAMDGAELLIEKGCDLILAIGGGSPMDCAKCISIVSTNGGNILDYEGVDVVGLPGPPLICIPSTSGTSADVSQFAIINDESRLLKKAIISKKVVPDLALIDPVPLMTMDAYLTACTGLDALTHAIEAYVSNAQSALTDIHALEAIKRITHNIEKAIDVDRRDIETMQGMLLGSLTAGLAFSNASLGAVHAMAHALGGLLDLPHGECNSVLLKHVINVNYEGAKERYQAIGKAMNLPMDGDDNTNKEMLLDAIDYLRAFLGINESICIAEKSDSIIKQLAENALNDPCMITNPVELSKSEIRGIYERILKEE
jgi:alcohol dehydrogenase class IV